jgi:hypothetical protein
VHLQLLLVDLPHVLIFFDGAARDEAQDGDVSPLSQSKRSILSLQVPTDKRFKRE